MKGILIGIDYVPSSGKIKLLEINTNILLGGYGQLHLAIDFTGIAKYCARNKLTKVIVHQSKHEHVTYDWKGNPIYMFDEKMQFKLKEALLKYKIALEIFVDTKWPDHLTDLSSEGVLDLRQAYSSFSKVDWFAQSKDRLRNFLEEKGFGDWMPKVGIENISIKPDGIPDYVTKIPNKDAQQGIKFFEKTNFIPEEGFVEDFILPDNDKWGWFCEGRYTCVLTELGDVIPLSTPDSLHLNRFTFKRANLDDYSLKQLRLGYKIPSFGIARENAKFLLESGSELDAHSIHLNSLNKNYDEVVAYKVDDIDMGLEDFKVIEERTQKLTENVPNTFTKGTNNFIFVPKWTENCVAVNGTIVSPRAIIPTFREGGVKLVQAKDLKIGDYLLDSNLNPKPITRIDFVGVQPLIYPQPIRDMDYHRTLICNDMAIVCESQFFNLHPPEKHKTSRYVVGTELLDQELEMLRRNVTDGKVFDWRKYQPLLQKRSEELLKLIYNTFGKEVWVW